jgi:large subunit ribosomal protein L25
MTKRDKLGTRPSRQLRSGGKVPAIIYGHGEGNVPVVLDEREIRLAIRHGERLLKADLDGEEKNLLIREVQYDYLGIAIVHVDLTPVRLDERVVVTVPIVLRGIPVGVSQESGALTQSLAQVKVECLVTAIPEELRVSVANLHANEQLRVADLQLPEGLKVLEDPDHVVASITVLAEEVAAPAAAEAAPAEPEVIGAKKEEEEAGEEEEKK